MDLALAKNSPAHLETRCIRQNYTTKFYACLSYIALMRKNPTRFNREDVLRKIAMMRNTLATVASVNAVNYAVWINLLDAEVYDITGVWPTAGKSYEDALEHAQKYGFILEEALTYELYGEALLRRSQRRPARSMFVDCVATYRRISAFGKCEQVKQLYLSDDGHTVVASTADASTQTNVIDTGHMTLGFRTKEDQLQ